MMMMMVNFFRNSSFKLRKMFIVTVIATVVLIILMMMMMRKKLLSSRAKQQYVCVKSANYFIDANHWAIQFDVKLTGMRPNDKSRFDELRLLTLPNKNYISAFVYGNQLTISAINDQSSDSMSLTFKAGDSFNLTISYVKAARGSYYFQIFDHAPWMIPRHPLDVASARDVPLNLLVDADVASFGKATTRNLRLNGFPII